VNSSPRCLTEEWRTTVARTHFAISTFNGNVYRNGRFWLAEIPAFRALTQGRTRKQALAMAADWLETMVNRKGFRAEVRPRKAGRLKISGNDPGAMLALRNIR
jgi:predicted RNase H-like HicB family nuclease